MSLVIYNDKCTPLYDMPAEIVHEMLRKPTFKDEEEAFHYVRNQMTTCKIMPSIMEKIRVEFNNCCKLPLNWFFKHLHTSEEINTSVSFYLKSQKNQLQCVDTSELFKCNGEFIKMMLDNQRDVTSLVISIDNFSKQLNFEIKKLPCLKNLEIKFRRFDGFGDRVFTNITENNDEVPSSINLSMKGSKTDQPVCNQNLEKLTVELINKKITCEKSLEILLQSNLNIKELHLKSLPISKVILKRILMCTELKKIILDRCTVPNFTSLATLKHLEEFEARSSKIKCAKVEHFKDCPALKKITLTTALDPFSRQDMTEFKNRVQVFISPPKRKIKALSKGPGPAFRAIQNKFSPV